MEFTLGHPALFLTDLSSFYLDRHTDDPRPVNLLTWLPQVLLICAGTKNTYRRRAFSETVAKMSAEVEPVPHNGDLEGESPTQTLDGDNVSEDDGDLFGDDDEELDQGQNEYAELIIPYAHLLIE